MNWEWFRFSDFVNYYKVTARPWNERARKVHDLQLVSHCKVTASDWKWTVKILIKALLKIKNVNKSKSFAIFGMKAIFTSKQLALVSWKNLLEIFLFNFFKNGSVVIATILIVLSYFDFCFDFFLFIFISFITNRINILKCIDFITLHYKTSACTIWSSCQWLDICSIVIYFYFSMILPSLLWSAFLYFTFFHHSPEMTAYC